MDPGIDGISAVDTVRDKQKVAGQSRHASVLFHELASECVTPAKATRTMEKDWHGYEGLCVFGTLSFVRGWDGAS